MKVATLKPSEQWEHLKIEMLHRIAAIDNDTSWQEVEPEWWLHMMKVERLIRNRE